MRLFSRNNPDSNGARGLGTVPTDGSFRPADPDNVSSDLAPIDRKGVETMRPEVEAKWVKYALDRFHEARTNPRRQEMERRVLQALAMLGGDDGQWRMWRGDDLGFYDLRVSDQLSRYVTDDQIAPILDRVASLMTSSRPDANIGGRTTTPIDQAAGKEAAGVVGAWEDDYNLQGRLLDAVNLIIRTSTLWAHTWWDPNKQGLVPDIDPQTGQIRKMNSGRAGGPVVDLIPWYQGFPYSDVTDAHEMHGFVIAKMMSLNELIDRYGDRAKSVEPDGNGDTLTYFQTRYAYLSGNWDYQAGNTATGNKTQVVAYELMEPATPRYPKGLRLVVAGDRCLHVGPLPGANPKKLPLTSVCYHRRDGTPWGANVVTPLAPLQRTINRAWTDVLDMLDNQRVYVAVEEGTDLDPDAYRRQDVTVADRHMTRVYYKTGRTPPQFQVPPTPTAEALNVRATALDAMHDISGIKDAVAGEASAGDSGKKVELLQMAGKAQLSLATKQVEDFVRGLTEQIITLYAENAKTSVLMAGSQTEDPKQRAMEVGALRALNAGGQTRVRITPGSAMPKLPAAADEQIQKLMGELLQAQTPAQLAAIVACLKAMSWQGSNEIADDLADLVMHYAEELKAQQPPPAPPPPDPAEVARLRAQQLAEQQHADHQHAVDLAEIDLHKEQELAKMKTDLTLRVEAFKRLHPEVRLSASADPTGVVGVEKMAGIEGKVPPVPKPVLAGEKR